MASQTEQHVKTEVEQDVKKGAKSLKGFFNKFNNDWVMNFASALAFNLITAILPILIAIIAVVGFTVGNLSPTTETQLIDHLKQIFPASGSFLSLAFTSLSKSAGFLAIIAVLLAIFGGSRLFISMEGYFDIIYHVRPRGVIKQNIMAIIMLLIFIVLTVPMTLAASIPAALQAISRSTPLSSLTTNGFINWLVSIIVSLLISWVLFVAIYIVVPNQHISFRNSRLGAIIAAVLLQIYLQLFPLYVTHFLGSYTGNIALAVVLLFFFYYFAVILLIGAEINAYFSEGIQVTPDNLAVMVHNLTSHLATSQKDVQEQAAPSHKNEDPKTILPQNGMNQPSQQGRSMPGSDQPLHMERADSTKLKPKKRRSTSSSTDTPRALVFAEVLAGTSLAFFVQLFQLRRKK